MIRLGVVAAGPAVRIADGTQASAGDLILCTRNDHTVHAREPGRTLANGDLLRIEQVTAAGLIVRRALDADPATGQRQWTDRQSMTTPPKTPPTATWAWPSRSGQGRAGARSCSRPKRLGSTVGSSRAGVILIS
jgi:hypothetical protein